MSGSVRTSNPALALVLGVVIALVATAMAGLIFSPATGHRINIAALPAEARAILAEHPGVPITREQWRRVDQVLDRSGGALTVAGLFRADLRSSWALFVV